MGEREKTRSRQNIGWGLIKKKVCCTESHVPFPSISLTTEDVTHYKMAWRALESHQLVASQPSLIMLDRGWAYDISTAFVQRCKDWPKIYDIFELPIALGFTTAGLIYGGLHALAWFAHFGSSNQQLLWRISACVVMGGFPVIWVLMEAFKYIDIHFTDSLHLNSIFVRFILTALALVVLGYMLARAYLVVECFINLSHLPAGAYDVPNWASYFPHVS